MSHTIAPRGGPSDSRSSRTDAGRRVSRFGRALVGAAVLLLGSGCTAVNVARVPQARTPGELLITQEALHEPYESKGLLQITRKGAVVFGFADIPGTDLEAAIAELGPEIRKRGADALVNMQVEQTQYTTFRKVVAILHFFVPLPSEVTIRGELVKRSAPVAAPPADTSPPPGASPAAAPTAGAAGPAGGAP